MEFCCLYKRIITPNQLCNPITQHSTLSHTSSELMETMHTYETKMERIHNKYAWATEDVTNREYVTNEKRYIVQSL
jgi:hypothetical protein